MLGAISLLSIRFLTADIDAANGSAAKYPFIKKVYSVADSKNKNKKIAGCEHLKLIRVLQRWIESRICQVDSRCIQP
jgi:hypothetical protein